MTKNNNVPQIRFKGFTDTWEQRELGTIIKENLKPVPKPEGEYIRLGIRSHAKGTFHEVVPAGGGLDVDTMYAVEANNLIVNITFAWEEAWAITTDEDAEKLVSHRFPQYKFNLDQYPIFYKYRFNNARMKYDLELASPGGAGRNRVLNKSAFLKIPVCIPTSYEEQQQIGSYFRNLDNLITLHQRKCETLKKLKKSMLQKMFPKSGKSVPEIRFAGFTDAWEQRELGDMCDEFQSGKSIKASEITDSGEYAVYGGNGFRGYTDTYNHDGDYALIGRQGALCGNMNFSSGKAYFTEHAVAVHGNADNDTLFLYYLLDLMNLGQYSGQSAQPGLAVNKIIQLKTKTPKLDEQRLISSFFKQLDSLITLHQRKLETLKKLKKSMLQKMFI